MSQGVELFGHVTFKYATALISVLHYYDDVTFLMANEPSRVVLTRGAFVSDLVNPVRRFSHRFPNVALDRVLAYFGTALDRLGATTLKRDENRRPILLWKLTKR